MTKYHKQHFAPFSIVQLYDLIIDIESYPEFLPWCHYAKIIESHDQFLIADLGIHYKIFRERYRSHVQLTPPTKEGIARVDVKMIQGPFKYLENQWMLQATKEGTIIDFHILFEFNSIIMEKLIGSFFSLISKKMTEAFITRAENLYKK